MKNLLYAALVAFIIASAIIVGTSGESILIRYLGVLWTIFFAVCLYREIKKLK